RAASGQAEGHVVVICLSARGGDGGGVDGRGARRVGLDAGDVDGTVEGGDAAGVDREAVGAADGGQRDVAQRTDAGGGQRGAHAERHRAGVPLRTGGVDLVGVDRGRATNRQIVHAGDAGGGGIGDSAEDGVAGDRQAVVIGTARHSGGGRD